MPRSHQVHVALLACLTLLALPAAAKPTATTGEIVGTAYDQAGQPLVGVLVTATPATAPRTPSKSFTNAAGKFVLGGLRPDIYELLARAPKLRPQLQKGIKVAAGKTVEANVILEVDSRQEEVRVVSRPPTVSTRTPNVLEAGDVDSLESLPAPRALAAKAKGRAAPPPAAAFTTETYDHIAEAGFHSPKRDPLSTFAIDVDTASYANVRRFLAEGQLPPAGAVRIEELLNYFPFAYPAPTGNVPFSASFDEGACPWNRDARLVRIGLRGRDISIAQSPPANLVFLIDVSGSMDEPRKLPLVQRSLALLVDKLRARDQIALAVYAGASGLVLPPTPVSHRGEILAAIDDLTAGGSTNGAAGIKLAYETARKAFRQGGNNRVILATDGDFNVGVTSQSELVALIEKEAKAGVFLTVLGFGTGNYKDSTMEKLADHGNGNYAYIDDLAEAKKVLVEQLAGTLLTIAKDVKVQVELNPARVGAYRLIGYENRRMAAQDFNDDGKDGGEIGAGHTVTALYEILPPGPAAERALGNAKVDPLRYASPAAAPSVSADLLTVKVRYKEPDGRTSRKLEFPLADRDAANAPLSPDLRFAAAVTAFGLVLRGSPLRGTADLALVDRLLAPGLGADPSGHRAGFAALVASARKLPLAALGIGPSR